jgi:hypothetical protein
MLCVRVRVGVGTGRGWESGYDECAHMVDVRQCSCMKGKTGVCV